MVSDYDPSKLLGRDTFRSSIRTSTIFKRFMMGLVLVRTEPVAFITDNILIVDEYDGIIEPYNDMQIAGDGDRS